VIPPPDFLAETVDAEVREILEDQIREQLLEEHGYNELVDRAFDDLEKPRADVVEDVLTRMADELSTNPVQSWEDVVSDAVENMMDSRP
jgi:hypothetical protein